MAKSSSVHDDLKRRRKPRVHITYDVETEGAVETQELPFVVGVMGDFSGDPTEEPKDLRDRDFITIDRDNFDEVMQRMNVGLDLKVDNTLQDDGSQFNVHLEFNSLQDFDPDRVAEQVEPIRELLETREKLRELQSQADREPRLGKRVGEILQNQAAAQQIASELGLDESSGGDGGGGAEAAADATSEGNGEAGGEGEGGGDSDSDEQTQS